MYIVLNYELKFKEEKDNFHQISIDKDKDIILDYFDIVKLNKIVRENYKLGESIHVYCLDKDSFKKETNELDDKYIYKFKIKKEVSFKDLKYTSNHKQQNDFKVYKFCSMIDTLIQQNQWEKCIEGLIETLDFKNLIQISIYLRGIPKNQSNISLINSAIERIEEKALLKSFELNSVEIKDIIKLLDYQYTNESLIISRLKNHIYSEDIDLNVLENEIDILSELSNKNLLNALSEDYGNKLILIYSSTINNNDKKEIFKKCESLFLNIIDFLEISQCDTNKIKEKYNFLVKQNKRLLF